MPNAVTMPTVNASNEYLRASHSAAGNTTESPVVQLADAIEDFWLHPVHRRPRSWQDHENINMVMLASSLMPDGVLRL